MHWQSGRGMPNRITSETGPLPTGLARGPVPGTRRLYDVGWDGGFSVRSVMVLKIQASYKVFVKGIYTEELDKRDVEDAEPLR